jgi:hypothetical protein
MKRCHGSCSVVPNPAPVKLMLPNGSTLSCEPQRLRGSLEAPKFRRHTLTEVDWNALWLVSCNPFHEKASPVRSRSRVSPGRRGDVLSCIPVERTTRLPSALSLTSLFEVGAH